MSVTANQEPGWVGALADAMERCLERPEVRFAQLATVDPVGHARCTTLVIRHVDREQGAVRFVAHGQDDKVALIAAGSRAELCWYFIDEWEQFRLAGVVRLIGPGEEASPAVDPAAVWKTLSAVTQAQLFWPDPARPRRPGDELMMDLDAEEMPPGFRVGVLTVDTVDHLLLTPEGQRRRRYRRLPDGTWHTVDG